MPGTAEDWLRVARERSFDATILNQQGRRLAAVYMAGYVIECSLKALLRQRNKRFPTSGREGHNLRGLWEAGGFKLSDLRGECRRFIESWDTKLRYEEDLPQGFDGPALFMAAMRISGKIKRTIRNDVWNKRR